MAARRTTLSAWDRYKLRLLVDHARFYAADTSLRSLARRGLVEPTGHTDEANRMEWKLSAAGCEALSTIELPLSANDAFDVKARERKA